MIAVQSTRELATETLCCPTKQTEDRLTNSLHFCTPCLLTFLLFVCFGFLMRIFFQPSTRQHDKALEPQPVDRLTQFLQMETRMPENWNCLIWRDEGREDVSCVQRPGPGDTHRTLATSLNTDRKTVPSTAKASRVAAVLLLLPVKSLYPLDTSPLDALKP